MIEKLKQYDEYDEGDKRAIDNLLHALSNLPEGFMIEVESGVLDDQSILDGEEQPTSIVTVVEHCMGSYKHERIAFVRKNIVW